MIIIILTLAFISIYIGLIGHDESLKDGKNLVHFTFIYCLGRLVRRSNVEEVVTKKALVCCYICLNLLICILNYVFFDTSFQHKLMRLSFYYNSPILILNALLLFGIFLKLKVHSLVISRIARCTFAIYLIHSNSHIGDVVWNLPYCSTNIISCCILGLMMFVACILVDIILCRIYIAISNSIISIIEKYIYVKSPSF